MLDEIKKEEQLNEQDMGQVTGGTILYASCLNCRKLVPTNVTVCPYCGKKPDQMPTGPADIQQRTAVC